MKAVFLDRNTLSERIDVDIPKGVAQWVAFQKTAPDEIVQRLKPADIAIVNKVKIDESILRQLPNLKLIHLTATGMDNIDKEAAKALGIEVKKCSWLLYRECYRALFYDVAFSYARSQDLSRKCKRWYLAKRWSFLSY